MNALPGLLVEYFINGAIALIWIAAAYFPDKIQLNNNMVFLLIPIVYVLGMFIDVLGYLLTFFPKKWIRKTMPETNDKVSAEETSGLNKSSWNNNEMKVLIASKYHELSKELTFRSSRDRVCRGMVINAIGITLLVPQVSAEIGLCIIVISVGMWIIFERQSHKYFLSACKVIEALEG